MPPTKTVSEGVSGKAKKPLRRPKEPQLASTDDSGVAFFGGRGKEGKRRRRRERRGGERRRRRGRRGEY
eukprot:5995925-Pyramimonas_sp.AAC.1